MHITVKNLRTLVRETVKEAYTQGMDNIGRNSTLYTIMRNDPMQGGIEDEVELKVSGEVYVDMTGSNTASDPLELIDGDVIDFAITLYDGQPVPFELTPEELSAAKNKLIQDTFAKFERESFKARRSSFL